MSRQSPGQRWCSVVLLAVFLSLFLYYGLPAMAYRFGRAIEAGRNDRAVQSELEAQIAAASAPSVLSVDEPPPDDAWGASFERASRDVRPAVVRIHAQLTSKSLAEESAAAPGPAGPSPQGPARESRGCGIVIDAQGYVLTSRRVVAGAEQIRIYLAAHERAFPATVAGSDARTDLAVLKFEPPAGSMAVASLHDAAMTDAGEYVMAVGNAYHAGEFLWVGLVNACGREASPAGCDRHDCIRTAAINSLNCGGPLVNMRGRVVGINTSLRGVNGAAEGLAVPAATARQIVEQLRSRGRIARGWLGVFIHKASLRPETRPGAGAWPEEALAVAVDYVVPGSPAEQGDIRAGDVILAFAGAPFRSALELRRRIATTAPSQEEPVTLVREGRTLEQRVVMGPVPARSPELPGEKEWGIRLLGHITADEARHMGIDHLAGVVVKTVAPGSKVQELRPRDVILTVNDVATPSLEVFCREVSRLSASVAVRLEVSSRGDRKTVVVGGE